jgi:hypothetical protein
MRDGIYKVLFESHGRTGFNIVAASNGVIAGCGYTHFTTGTYKIDDNQFKARLHLTRHSKRDDCIEIVNQDEIDIKMSGICSLGFGEFDARVVGRSDIDIIATFQWVCDL